MPDKLERLGPSTLCLHGLDDADSLQVLNVPVDFLAAQPGIRGQKGKADWKLEFVIGSPDHLLVHAGTSSAHASGLKFQDQADPSPIFRECPVCGALGEPAWKQFHPAGRVVCWINDGLDGCWRVICRGNNVRRWGVNTGIWNILLDFTAGHFGPHWEPGRN